MSCWIDGWMDTPFLVCLVGEELEGVGGKEVTEHVNESMNQTRIFSNF